MLFRCNYVALVIAPTIHPTATQPPESTIGHKVVIWDDLKQRGVIQLEFNAEVRAVRLRRDRIVVVSKTLIKVFTFTASPQQLHVFDTAPNWRGLCSLSPSSANSLLAFPSPECDAPNVITSGHESSSAESNKSHGNKISSAHASTSGNVKLIDLADTDKQPMIIPAHSSKLTCLMLNIQGTKLATASDKGTLIRIFNSQDGNLLTELRRGSQPATIYSINFSPDSSLLVASSSHGTIHVFSADDSSKNKTSSLVSTATAMVGNLFGSSNSSNVSNMYSKSNDSGSNANTTSGNSSNFSSKFVPKYFTSEWSFSRIEVPGATKCIVAFTQNAPSTSGSAGSTNMTGKNNFGIMAVCADGSYHKFVYDERKEDFTRDNYHMFVESDSK